MARMTAAAAAGNRVVDVTATRGEGGSRNGKASTTPRSSAAIRRITAASDERRISGSV